MYARILILSDKFKADNSFRSSVLVIVLLELNEQHICISNEVRMLIPFEKLPRFPTNIGLVIPQLLALVLISFGIYVAVSYNLNEIGQLTAYGYVGLGAAALLVVLWGYLSAWRENVCCTVTVSQGWVSTVMHGGIRFYFLAVHYFPVPGHHCPVRRRLLADHPGEDGGLQPG